MWLDHLSYRCTDYQKAAAFYVALLGWKVRSDDGAQAVLEIGDNAGDIIIQEYQAFSFKDPDGFTVRIGDIAGAIIIP